MTTRQRNGALLSIAIFVLVIAFIIGALVCF